LKAGAHFGHKTERWNPKMLKFIHGEKNGVHIINLDDTYQYWLKARKYIVDIASRGGNVLFVGTKHQARDIVANSAKLCDSSYVNNRWLGGTLSNFQTIKNSMRRLKNLEDLLESAADSESKVRLAKKERLEISRQVEKLEHNLGGLRTMRTLPDVIFIVDIKKESSAVAEARKLHIPVVALVDTNVDPQKVEMGIPANDDAYKTIKIFLEGLAEAVIEGKKVFKSRMNEQSKINAKAVRGGKKKEVEVNSGNESAAGQM
jgi:small subunit ribosomal protein S2